MHLPGLAPVFERVGQRHAGTIRENNCDRSVAARFDTDNRVIKNTGRQPPGFGQFFTFPVESHPATVSLFAPEQGVVAKCFFFDRQVLRGHQRFSFAVDDPEQRVFFYAVKMRNQAHKLIECFRVQHIAVAVVQAVLVLVTYDFAELKHQRVCFCNFPIVDALKTGYFLQFRVVKSRVFGELQQIMQNRCAAWEPDTAHGIRQ